MLSILILTHNRPNLFKRCIESVINQNFGFDVEIIVNNDTSDIEEICLPNIKYHYKKFDNLANIYKFLFDQASGEYIYFLEDDDYLVPNFAKIIESYIYKIDLIIGQYNAINKTYQLNLFKEYVRNKNKLYCPDNFQLGQILFKKEILNFPMFDDQNHVENDEIIFKNLNPKSYLYLKEYFFIQGYDGQNISKEYII